MNSMEDVFNALKNEFNDIEINLSLDNYIIIKFEKYRIKVLDDTIIFFENNKEITHNHFNYDYNKALSITKHYIKNKFKIKREYLITNLIIIVILIIVGIVINIFRH